VVGIVRGRPNPAKRLLSPNLVSVEIFLAWREADRAGLELSPREVLEALAPSGRSPSSTPRPGARATPGCCTSSPTWAPTSRPCSASSAWICSPPARVIQPSGVVSSHLPGLSGLYAPLSRKLGLGLRPGEPGRVAAELLLTDVLRAPGPDQPSGAWRGALGALTGLALGAAVPAGTPVAKAATTPAHSSTWRSYPTAVGAFNAVSCASSRFCLAVGWSTGTDYFVTYNGRARSPARLAEQYEGEMEPVSCPVLGWCAAITGLSAVTVFQRGHWSKLTTVDPNPGPPYPGMVAAISCPSPRYCVAVDGQGNAETFDGTGWSRPRLVDPDYPLNDVSRASAGAAPTPVRTQLPAASWSSPSGRRRGP